MACGIVAVGLAEGLGAAAGQMVAQGLGVGQHAQPGAPMGAARQTPAEWVELVAGTERALGTQHFAVQPVALEVGQPVPAAVRIQPLALVEAQAHVVSRLVTSQAAAYSSRSGSLVTGAAGAAGLGCSR
ncbi:MAG: hypothetical protein WCF44_13905 [Candidatus Methylophosphatis roskildensis]